MLENILSKNEGKTLEFKESTQTLSGIIKTIVAFANTAGGTIVIGIKDKTKEIVGIKNVLKEEERLANAIAESIAPSIMPDIEIQTIRDKEIILLHVYHAVGPYYLKSGGPGKGVYIRLGSTSRIADVETVHRLRLFAKNRSPDEIPHLQGKKSSLDWIAIEEEFKKVDKTVSDHKAQLLGLLTEQSGKLYPTIGGILSFGLQRSLLFPDAIIQCARFAGHDKVTFIDHDDIDTHMPLAIQKVISFIQKNTRVRSVIGKMRRVDIPQYPPVAIREAVINAILHADYDMKGSSLSVAIFEDRIEITNPGGLHFGMTIENALAGASRLRNRALGRIFRELKLIEKWGSGLKRIQAACKQHGLKDPLFQELNNQFRVTLYAPAETNATTPKTASKRRTARSTGNNVIDFLKKHGEISTKKAAELWAVTTRTARVTLKRMVEEGTLHKIATSPKDPHAVFILRAG